MGASTATLVLAALLPQLGPWAPAPLPSSAPPATVVLSCFETAARIAYLEDSTAYWQSPAETHRLGTGDCEDKALYLQALIRRAGLAAEVVFGVTEWERSGACLG